MGRLGPNRSGLWPRPRFGHHARCECGDNPDRSDSFVQRFRRAMSIRSDGDSGNNFPSACVLRNLMRIHSHICSVAYPVLDLLAKISPEKTKQSRFTAYWSYITLAMLASAARALVRQMKSAVRVSVLAGGLRRLGGDRVSSQLPQLPSKKGSHRRRTKRNYFIERRREFWLLD